MSIQCHIAISIAVGMAYLHSKHVVHRYPTKSERVDVDMVLLDGGELVCS